VHCFTMEAYTCEQLSKYTWKVVENDPYGQYPFLYVILGEDKCIIIDSGCGKCFSTQHLDLTLTQAHQTFVDMLAPI
jgi:hypothetical protein